MKTLMFYINSLNKGGAERVFVQLAERFAQYGYRTVIVTSFVDKAKGEYELSNKVLRLSLEQEQIIQSKLKRNFSRIKKLRTLCKEYKPEVLISCMQEPNFRALLATVGLPVKNLVSVCSAPEREYPGFMGQFVAKCLMPTAEGCVFQTEEQKAWFSKKLQRKSRIIMNQVNESFFSTSFEGERKNIVHVGRLNHAKNQAMLIRAFSRIADRTEENLLIYGAGELFESLKQLIAELRLEKRVFLMGNTNDVAGTISDAKLFAFSSDYEGLPNALLEAMALALPCVSTNCHGGGPAMVIRDGENGILTPIGDEQALAEAMLHILQNPKLAANLGRAAKQSAECFRPETVFKHWQDYVEDLIK